MTHNQQLTVKTLRSYLALLPDSLPIFVGYGEGEFPACFLSPTPRKDGLVLKSNVYKEDASLYNVKTIIELKNKED